MARPRNRLSARTVATRLQPGYYGDGGGLYLQVSKALTKSWIYRFTLNGQAREMGLGSFITVSLEDARKRAQKARELVEASIDPIEHRKAQEAASALAEASSKNFREVAKQCIAALAPEWRNAKHVSQWENTLEAYVYPKIGDLPIAAIATPHVLEVLEPIWTAKTETASRVRGRVEKVLSWAAARGYRTKDNPATWRGHLDSLLAKPKKIRKVQHHPALPYERIGKVMKDLRKQSGVAAAALEFTILTAARLNEAAKARWPEIDTEAAVWTVPAERMKANRPHRVPLSKQALAVLEQMEPLRSDGDYVFPSPMLEGQPISAGALLVTVKNIAGDEYTAHGFRSTFRDWAAERTNYPNIVPEAALAHVVGDKTEAAYRRGDLFDKRKRMMADWAKFCDTPSAAKGNVVPLRKAAK